MVCSTLNRGDIRFSHVDLDNWLWSCCACLPGCVGVFPLRLLLLPRLASPVTLLSLSLSLSLSRDVISILCGHLGCWPGLDRSLDVMSILVFVALFYTMTDTLFWDLPGHVLAAPASALCGWKGVNSLSLSLSLHQQQSRGQKRKGWKARLGTPTGGAASAIGPPWRPLPRRAPPPPCPPPPAPCPGPACAPRRPSPPPRRRCDWAPGASQAGSVPRMDAGCQRPGRPTRQRGRL